MKMVGRSLAILGTSALAALAPGCGSDDEGEADSTTEETAEAVLPDPVTAAGADTVKVEDRLIREIRFEGGPDWMVPAFDSLWVKEDSGTTDRVDPQSGKVVARISAGPFKQPVCQGLGASDEAIWACPKEGEVVRIDPKSNSLAATIKIDKLLNQGRLVAAAERLWVLTDAGNELTGIDLETNKSAKPIPLPAPCFDLAVSGDTLWAACPQDDLVLQIDARAGDVADEIELPGVASVAVGEDIFVAFDNGVAQVDGETLEVSAVYDVFPGGYGGIYATDDAVWVREEQGTFLTRIDPNDQRIVERIKAPEYPSGGDVVAIGNSVWATASDDNVLVELRAEGG